MNSLTPKNIEEALIFAKDYGIDLNKLQKTKQYQDLKELFKDIGKQAFVNLRKKSYKTDYTDLLNNKLISLKKINYNFANDEKNRLELLENLILYLRENDNININNYKRILPNGLLYPFVINDSFTDTNFIEQIKQFCHYKFKMLKKYMSLTCKSNT